MPLPDQLQKAAGDRDLPNHIDLELFTQVFRGQILERSVYAHAGVVDDAPKPFSATGHLDGVDGFVYLCLIRDV